MGKIIFVIIALIITALCIVICRKVRNKAWLVASTIMASLIIIILTLGIFILKGIF